MAARRRGIRSADGAELQASGGKEPAKLGEALETARKLAGQQLGG